MEASTGRRWAGAYVVIIASGPSLTVEDCERVRAWKYYYEFGKKYGAEGKPGRSFDDRSPDRRVVVINTSYQRAPFADVLYACDDTWWDRNIEGVRAMFHGEQWTQSEVAAKRHGINYIKSERKEGLSKTPGVIHQGSNSGFQAINLAQQWGAKRIILLGFDMSDDGAKTHWHKPHNATKSPYERWIEMFRILAIDLKAEGVSVVNCTRRTALNCFPLAKLEEALDSTHAIGV